MFKKPHVSQWLAGVIDMQTEYYADDLYLLAKNDVMVLHCH